MGFCAKCGSALREAAQFCTKCGTAIAVAATQPIRQPRAEVLPPSTPRAVLMVRQKSSGLAVVLSFFWSGLGQLYTGQIAKGIIMMIVYPTLFWLGMGSVFAGGLVAMGSQNPDNSAAGGGLAVFGLLALVGALALWVYGMVNAYQTAERQNLQQLVGL